MPLLPCLFVNRFNSDVETFHNDQATHDYV